MDHSVTPFFIRFPGGAARCLHTGLTRGFLHDLTVPCCRNDFHPPVASFLVGKGHRKVRLICVESLRDYLGSHAASADNSGLHTKSAPASASPRPLFVRVPRSGEKCPYSGLTRSTLLSLVLPSHDNEFPAPVASLAPRKPGAKRGIRLVVWAALEAYIRSQRPCRQAEAEPLQAAG